MTGSAKQSIPPRKERVDCSVSLEMTTNANLVSSDRLFKDTRMHIKDKVCVVTGAAGGIGESVARAYATAGARGVVVADLQSSRDRLASVAGDIDGFAGTADVGQESDIQALIAAAKARFGPVDIFFSN